MKTPFDCIARATGWHQGGWKFTSQTSIKTLTWWIGFKNEYYEFVSIAKNALLPFISVCLCEAAFSSTTVIKSKYYSKPNLEPDL